MATIHGNEGTVKVGAAAVAEIESFSIDRAADTVESTVMGTMAKTFKPSKTSWSGEISCIYDPTDTTGQGALVNGTTVTLALNPEGDDTSGDLWYGGSAIITGSPITTQHDELVKVSFSFQGTGALTETTVA